VQLRELEVRNIRSFESGRLELGTGTTLLVGDVGAGKSSLLYAVEMALFGTAEVDAAFLVRHGTAHAEVAVTLADDEHRYAVRRRFRKVKRRGRESYEPERLTYSEDGSLATYSATEIRQRVIELLGFPDNPNPHAHSDLWRWAIYVPQERMREILAADPEERLETVRKALGVERYRIAAENAQALASDLKVAARRRREEADRLAHFDVEFAEAVREGDRLRSERGALAEALERSAGELLRARGEREREEQQLARAEADLRELEALEREELGEAPGAEAARRRDDEIDRDLMRATQEATPLRAAASERAAVLERRDAADRAVRARRAELDRHAEELRQLTRLAEAEGAARRRLEEAEARLREASSLRDADLRARDESAGAGPAHEPPAPTLRTAAEIEQAIGKARAAEQRAVEELSRDRSALGQVDELLAAGVCPTCHQSVRSEQFGPHRLEAATLVTAAEEGLARQRAAVEALEEERKSRERYERALERWHEVEARRAEARERLRQHEGAVTAAANHRRSAEQELADLLGQEERLRPLEAEGVRLRAALEGAEREAQECAEAAQRALASAERLRALETIARQLGEERGRLRAEIERRELRQRERGARLAALRPAATGAAALRTSLDGARRREREVERRNAEAQQVLVRADTRLDAVVGRQASAERGRAERAERVREVGELESRAAWVAEPFRLSVLRMEKELLAHAQTQFDRAFARFFASLVDDPSLTARTDASFTPEVMIAGEATPAEALSGGERTSLALAFRLALASVVRSLGAVRLETLLLDEPTDGFSSEQVVRMGELLEELALPQVVVVSHESQLTGIADRTIRVTKRDGRSALELDRADAAAPSEEGPGEAPEPASPPVASPAARRTR